MLPDPDPLDAVFETKEESLAHFLRSLPASLIPVFEREFMRRPTPRAQRVALAVDNIYCSCSLDELQLTQVNNG